MLSYVEYSDSEEDALWKAKPVKTGKRVRYIVRAANTKNQRFVLIEDAGTSWQVA